jgi:hypothetical protein
MLLTKKGGKLLLQQKFEIPFRQGEISEFFDKSMKARVSLTLAIVSLRLEIFFLP